MSKVRAALTRKLGPLPVWAWAAIAGVALFAYRASRGQYSGAATQDTGSGADTVPDEGREPVTLGPGESVYDPKTGQLIGTAPDPTPLPEGEGAGAGPAPPRPVILKPGQAIYDPNTHKLVTFPVPKPKKHKRRKKPKPHHKPPKHQHKPKHPGHHKPRPHGHGTVKHPQPRKKHKLPSHTGRPRRMAQTASKPAQRTRSGASPRTGAMRQRPAATHPTPHPASHAHPKATPPIRRRRNG